MGGLAHSTGHRVLHAGVGGIGNDVISVQLLVGDQSGDGMGSGNLHGVVDVAGPGVQNVFIAIGILGWPSIARVFRSAILSVKENDYVDAARAMGASDLRVIARHIFPNSVASIVVYATMNIGGAILTESALSYLGMGVVPPDPSWGNLISDGQTYLATQPWLMIMPGLAILTTVLAFTLLGDGLRDALDVKMKDA